MNETYSRVVLITSLDLLILSHILALHFSVLNYQLDLKMTSLEIDLLVSDR